MRLRCEIFALKIKLYNSFVGNPGVSFDVGKLTRRVPMRLH